VEEKSMSSERSPQVHDKVIVQRKDLQALFDALHRRGFQTIGPTIRDEVIVYDEIECVDELPIGWVDEQTNGSYRLRQQENGAVFAYGVGPHAWKRFLHPPVLRLLQAVRSNGQFQLAPVQKEIPQYAFIGVRACDMHGILVLDGVLKDSAHADPVYSETRRKSFVVAVNCSRAGNTCFCGSMGTGPGVSSGYDLALTEIIQEEGHFFVVDVGSEQGAAIVARVPHQAATESEVDLAIHQVAQAAGEMGRHLETEGLKDMLYRNLESPHWERVGARCLACGNCTMVCPTCFCSTVEDVTDLAGEQAERWRKADSCFTEGFTYVYGGSVRASTLSRYRQWLTHKLATWVDQFGTFGCVGCGRCITWCPVGIDITEEAQRIWDAEKAHA
jgi:sulfhydrogenase subunit beta (sulfur reductase)